MAPAFDRLMSRVEKTDREMAEQTFSIVIRGGTAVLPQGPVRADIGIRGETIAAIGENLGPGAAEIDASGQLVLPGGVDPHAHIEQVSGAGLLNADSFESATTSAAFGGTTTVIPFAAQHVSMPLDRVVADYHELAERGAVIDYAFHMILADPNETTLKVHIPKLVKDGHASIKVFMTYDRIKLDDEQVLNVLQAARDNGAFVCVHAENHGMITFMVKRLLAHGMTAPPVFGMSHPRLAEVDAIQRLVVMSRFIDQPIMVFHVSTAEGAEVVRKARADGVKIFGETCPHYLLLSDEAIDRPGLEGAKWMCSPPLRKTTDQEALWQALARGDLQVVSSDHAPYRFDATGKLSAGPNPTFKEIANGLPGVEARLPLLFDAMVTRGRLGLEKFVELTSAAPARIYGLYPRKGTIAVGSDADIAVWNPKKSMRLSASIMHDRAGYTPYEGLSVTGWPETVLSRGRVVVREGGMQVAPGSGRFLPRQAGEAAQPLGRPASEIVGSMLSPSPASRRASFA
jgi:dihydropyrimidinase